MKLMKNMKEADLIWEKHFQFLHYFMISLFHDFMFSCENSVMIWLLR